MKTPFPFHLQAIATLIAVVGASVTACGGSGSSDSSTTTTTGTATVPRAPTALVATAGNSSASIAFSAPASTGGSAITGYQATCVGAGISATGAGITSPVSVGSLTNATVYSCSVAAINVVGTGASSAAVTVTPAAGATSSGTFSVTSVASVGGALPSDYTCDGPGSTPALSWSGAPTGTTEFAVLMSTLPADGTTKYNWVLYGIPAGKAGLSKDSYGVGTLGVGSDGPIVAYQPPCSQGLGSKSYTFTVYALSASPTLASGAASGAALAAAMSSITLGKASLDLSYNRSATATGLGTTCAFVSSSVKASTAGAASVGCDSSYAYVASATRAELLRHERLENPAEPGRRSDHHHGR